MPQDRKKRKKTWIELKKNVADIHISISNNYKVFTINVKNLEKHDPPLTHPLSKAQRAEFSLKQLRPSVYGAARGPGLPPLDAQWAC